MRDWKFVIPVLVAVLFLMWYAFRPERLAVNRYVNEPLPTPEGGLPEAIALGRFHSVLHSTEGTATIYSLGDGNRILRLTNFKTSNGPDVHVYLVAADDAKDSATVQ